MPEAAQGPFEFSDVLAGELHELRSGRPAMAPALAALPERLAKRDEAARRRAVYAAAHDCDLSTLCLSGGGIRSASFCLGVIQALAENGLLTKFDYLSTVSGGGYIGAWLSAWLARAPDLARVPQILWSRRTDPPPKRRGYDPDPAAEPLPIEHLREYSNYLTAKVGLLSGDTWAAVAIVLRNMLLNWLILLPAIALVVIAFKLAAALAHATQAGRPIDAIVMLCVVLPGVSLGYKLLRLYWVDRSGDAGRAQSRFLVASLGTAVAAGLCFTRLAIDGVTPGAALAPLFRGWPASAELRSWLMMVAFGLIILAVAGLVANAGGPLSPPTEQAEWEGERRRRHKWNALSWLVAMVAFASAIWLGVHLANLLDQSVTLHNGLCVIQSVPCASGAKPAVALLPLRVNKEVFLVVFGMPWFLLSAMLAHTTYLLCASYSPWGDVEREWLGRASGWYVIAALTWAGLAGVILLGPKLYFAATIVGNNAGQWLTALSAVSGSVIAALGRSAVTPAQGAATGWKGIAANVGLAIAATVLATALLILFSAWSDTVVLYFFRLKSDLHADACFSIGGAAIPQSCYAVGSWLYLGLVLVAIALIGGLLVNVNRFSLHAIYRNRLIRAYLGASRAAERAPDPFTGFDWDDNLRVASLWPGPVSPDAPWRPFHVINMTLNLAATHNLAWQQRKAMSFAVTPKFAGAAALGYRETRRYGDPKGGMSLGTAMAISGAAVSPNMGYHSSPAIAFLLTLLDVRLGWWLGNPGPAGDRLPAWQARAKGLVDLIGGSRNRPRAPYTQDAPWFAITPLLAELFGLTDDDSPYVYLSDGGHFENLGLYEMVRRRCRRIIVVDAGADPARGFIDLGDAVRKIRIDLGARVSFTRSDLLQAGADAKPGNVPYYALGTIEYLGDGDPPPTGTILYIKPTVRGDEDAADVIAYKRADPNFPHQSTIDQWFDEPQLEAYRALGYLTVGAIVDAAGWGEPGQPADLQRLFDRLRDIDPQTLKRQPAPETT